MTLSRKQILYQCKKYKLVEPYNEKLVQTCSYDLTFGGEYQMYTSKKEDQNKKLRKSEKLLIPADAICFVLTNEKVNIPCYLTAHISLSLSLIKKGVMMAAQPPYDAGYSGKTLALLHNLSSEPVEIDVGQHILNIVFEHLTNAVEDKYLYSNRNGQYQNADSLEKFKISPKIKGGVFDLYEKLCKQKRRVKNSIPTILTVITVILGLITVFITIFGSASAVSSCLSSLPLADSSSGTSENVIKVVSFSAEENEVAVTIDGEVYRIDFDNLQIYNFE